MRRTIGLLALAALACAAQPQEKKRPRIGLALSGGSALGLAHLGVLRWLEENRVPIDCIAGSSMGSLIGGLFATGASAGEVEQFIAGIDWNAALAPAPPFRDLAFRRKEDRREFPNAIEFGLRHGVKWPTALSAGHGVGLLISRFAAPYEDLASFDDLPTPFRAVATDLMKGEEVRFDRGSLYVALRASMSLPAVFEPVRLGDKVLVDGGLLNNIPVDIVRSMGADIVIAVALDKPPDDSRFTSLLGVAGRSISVMISANERRSLGQADIVLMPALDGLGGSDYLKHEEFSKRGFEAAEKKRRLLAGFAADEQTWREWQRRRESRRRAAPARLQVVEVDGTLAPRRTESLIESLQAESARGLESAAIEAELTRLTGMGRFDSARYSFFERDGRDGLRVQLHEKTYGPPFFNAGILLDASRQEGFRFGVGGRLTFLDFGGPASEWRTDLSIGQVNRAGTEYYYRLRGGKWFVAPRFAYSEDTRLYWTGGRQTSEFVTHSVGGAIDLGYAFGRFQELRAGMSLARERIPLVGPDAFTALSGRSSDLHVRWVYEGQDNALVPRRGMRAVVSGEWVLDYPGVAGGFPMAEIDLGYAWPLGPKWSLVAQTAGGGAPFEAPLATRFTLGGLGRLDALGRGRLYGSRYYYGGGRLLRGLNNESLRLFGRFYLATSFEMGQAWHPGQSALPRYSGSAGLIGETPIGLVYFGGGFGDRGDRRFFFRLGRVF